MPLLIREGRLVVALVAVIVLEGADSSAPMRPSLDQVMRPLVFDVELIKIESYRNAHPRSQTLVLRPSANDGDGVGPLRLPWRPPVPG
jgi:hypothetical protein